MKRLLVFAALLLSGQAWGATRLGVYTDLHYATGNGRDTLSSSIQGLFTSEGVAARILLGDIIDDSADRSASQAQIAAIGSTFVSPTYWIPGNHDLQGTSLANWLADASAYIPSPTADGNWTVDFGSWRVIAVQAVSGFRYSASDTTLTWLESQLETARIESKYILVVTHPGLWQDFPGEPEIWLTANTAGTGVATPSGTTGSVNITTDADAFAAGDVGKRVALEYAASWGTAVITAYNNARDVTATVEQAFASAGAASSWIWLTGTSGYSFFAYNASSVRAKISAAKAAGSDIKGVICGHGHSNATSTVDSVVYYELPSAIENEGTDTPGNAAVIILEDDGTLRVAGTFSTTSRNYQQYFVDVAAGADTNSGRLRSHAWQSIAAGTHISGRVAGDITTVMAGTYTGGVALTSAAGAAGNPVVWTFEPGAVIDANGGSYGLYLSNSSHYVTLNSPVVIGATNASATDMQPAGIYLDGHPEYIIINDAVVSGCGIAGTKGAGIADATVGATSIEINRPVVRDNPFRGIGYKNGTTGKANINYGLITGSQYGISMSSNDAYTPSFKNCTITGNSINGFRNQGVTNPNPTLVNCIIYGNATDLSVGASGVGTISYSVVGSATYGNMTHSTGMIEVNPILSSSYRIAPSSPARNAGSNDVWAGTANVTDLAGRAITDAAGTIIAPGGTVDIGAYEAANQGGGWQTVRMILGMP